METHKRITDPKRVDLRTVEQSLRHTLRPVGPQQAYLADLRSRLMKAQMARRRRIRVFQYALLSLAAVAGGVLLIITSVRAALALLALVSFVRLYKERAATRPKALEAVAS